MFNILNHDSMATNSQLFLSYISYDWCIKYCKVYALIKSIIIYDTSCYMKIHANKNSFYNLGKHWYIPQKWNAWRRLVKRVSTAAVNEKVEEFCAILIMLNTWIWFLYIAHYYPQIWKYVDHLRQKHNLMVLSNSKETSQPTSPSSPTN